MTPWASIIYNYLLSCDHCKTKPYTSTAAVSLFSREEQTYKHLSFEHHFLLLISLHFSSYLLQISLCALPYTWNNLPSCTGIVQPLSVLALDPSNILLRSFNLFMSQFPLLCLHQGEICLLPECILPVLDCTHCDRDYRDRFPPDVKQCRSAGVIHNHESQRWWWIWNTVLWLPRSSPTNSKLTGSSFYTLHDPAVELLATGYCKWSN